MSYDLISKRTEGRNFARGVTAADVAVGAAGGVAFSVALAAILLPRLRARAEREADVQYHRRKFRRVGSPTMEMPAVTMDQIVRRPWSPIES
jgi:hypothetical protein